MMAIFPTILSMVVAAVLGMAAHRSSLCSVKAVVELLTTRRAYMLTSFAKTVLWVIAVTIALNWIARDSVQPVNAVRWTLLGLGGGFLFGVGAVVNGGCSFSTLTQLASGRIVIVLSLVGFCLGIAGQRVLDGLISLPVPAVTDPLIDLRRPGALVMLGGLSIWITWEILRLARSSTVGSETGRSLVAPRLKLSVAAALMGVSNGILYALLGSWAYTHTLGSQVQGLFGASIEPRPLLWMLFLSLLAGAMLSAWQAGQFRISWTMLNWKAHLSGGFLMGLGAAVVPGGNDVLILHGLPGFSPHALPVFAAMLLGITGTLLAVRQMGKPLPQVDCRGDICRESYPDEDRGRSDGPA